MVAPAAVFETLSTLVCCNCGIHFGVPASWEDSRRRDHEWFHCPNGHRQHFAGQSEAERLKAELEREQRRHEFTKNARDAADKRADTAEARRRAQKGITTKLKRRIASGECPACHETFDALRKHMTEEHPGFCGDDSAALPSPVTP